MTSVRQDHDYWRGIDRAVTAATAEGPGWWDVQCDPRAEQERVIAEWAFAHADPDASADLLEDLRIQLITSVGFDIRDTARDTVSRHQ